MRSSAVLINEFEKLSNDRERASKNISYAKELLSEIRASGQKMSNPLEREKFSEIARDLSDIIFGVTGELLPARLDIFTNSESINLSQAITNNIFESKKEEIIDQRNRRVLLNHVENFWVKGVLEKSLYGAALIELEIKENPDMVKFPWGIKKEATNETIPAGTSVLEIFEQVGLGRSLLILGSPGSGKTTMLLQMANQLIARARQNETEPIPIVFNLASWTEEHTLAQWLMEELNLIYYVPKKTSRDWLGGNKLLLLLDGLDEVHNRNRNKCVEAINIFRREHGLTSLVVCSRSQEYNELSAQLSFDGAIEIQPLTFDQVRKYFKRLGSQATGIQKILQKDTALRELVQSPLFLSIMTLAYRGIENKDILISKNIEVQRKYLLDAYIGHMFDRTERSLQPSFSEQDVLRWLTRLAHNMLLNDQLVFTPQNLPANWLNQNKVMKEYRFVLGTITGLIFSIMFGLVIGLFYRPIFGLTIGVIIGLLAGLVSGFLNGSFSFVKRYSLHLVLSSNNIFPWDIVSFLDYCTDLIFLRRVGGGYIFVHRLLMEHFADMYTEQVK
ncbi:MAG TPA: NACHT domain-containing protein [Anaerolineales bacterium]|nr:NACHT domain-containing protein [Anaerolineales bacterium]